jgi:cytoskeletal protein CcmA (bactofilin family)
LQPGSGAEPPQTAAVRSADQQTTNVETGTLIIGPGISFVGEITSCNRLVVDGMVEATLHRCQEVSIGEKGFFKGQARTENAEIRGRMEGELIVRKLLLVRTAGHVAGSTTYGEIEIERGGKIVGQLEAREGASPPR